MCSYRLAGGGAREHRLPPPAPHLKVGPVRGTGPAWRLLAVTVCAGLFAACSTIPKTPARLYGLDNAELIRVKLFYFGRGYGRATATLPDGGTLQGRYAVASTDQTPGRRAAVMADLDTVTQRAEYARVYGYNRSRDSHPVGYGMLSGDSGTTLTIVLYSVDPTHRYGTGVARDNHGNWYRIHIGTLNGD